MRRYLVISAVLALAATVNVRSAGAFDASDAIRAFGGAASAIINEAARQRREGSASGNSTEPAQQAAQQGIQLRNDRSTRRRVQEALNAHGYAAGTPDGVFGRKTRRAIRAYQRSIGERATGRLTRSQAIQLLGQGQTAGGQSAGSTGGEYELLHNYDLPGNDLAMIRNTDLGDCQALCTANPQCRAFTFNDRADVCFLKSGAGAQVAFSGAISGRRAAGGQVASALAQADAGQTGSLETRAAAGSALAAAQGLGLPAIDGYVANLIGDFNNYDERGNPGRWKLFLDQIILRERPELLESQETVSDFIYTHFSDQEKQDFYATIDPALVDGYSSPSFGQLDIFQKRRGAAVFNTYFNARYAPLAAPLPLPIVTVQRVGIGEYDFDNERFPIGYDNSSYDNSFFLLPENTAKAHANAGLERLPDFINVPEAEAETFWNSLQKAGGGNRRVAYIAVYGALNRFESDVEPSERYSIDEKDIGSLEGLRYLRPRFETEVHRMALFRHAAPGTEHGLTSLIEDYTLQDYLPQIDASDLQAMAEKRDYEGVLSIDVVSQAALVPVIDDYVADTAFVEEYTKTGDRYRSANEFQRDDVLVEEREKVAALRPEADTFWLGGQISLGSYSSDADSFSVQSLSLSTARNPDYYLGEVEITVENLDRFKTLAVSAQAAERAVTQETDRDYNIRVRVRPVAGDFEWKYGDRPLGRLGIEILEMYVLVQKGDDQSQTPFILAHVAPDGGDFTDATATNNPLPAWPERPVLNPDIVGLLTVHAMEDPLPETMLRQLFSDRWMFEKQIGTSVPGQFFDSDVVPSNLTFSRRREEFERWLRLRVQDMPAVFTVHWIGNSVSNDDICHRFTPLEGYSAALQSHMSEAEARRWPEKFRKWVEAGTPRGPSRASPMLFKTHGPPSNEYNYECDPRGREALNDEILIDDEVTRTSALVVDWMPLFMDGRSTHTDTTLASIDIAVDDIELVTNGENAPHVRILARMQEIRYHSTMDVNVTAPVDTAPQNLIARFDTSVFELSDAALAAGGGSSPEADVPEGGSIEDMILQGAAEEPEAEPEMITQAERTVEFNDGVSGFALSSSGRIALIGLPDDLSIWNLATGERVRQLIDYGGTPTEIGWSAQGRHAITAHSDGNIRLWDLVGGKLLKSFQAVNVRAIRFAPDGTRFLMVNDHSQLELYELESGAMERRYEGQYAGEDIALSADGTMVASGGGENVAIWDLETGELIRVLVGHTNTVRSAAFSPDGALIASGSSDDTVRLWDISSGQELRRFEGHGDDVNGVEFTSSGKYIVSASDDATMRVWDTATGRLVRVYVHGSPSQTDADGPWLASDSSTLVSTSYTMKVWNLDGLE